MNDDQFERDLRAMLEARSRRGRLQDLDLESLMSLESKSERLRIRRFLTRAGGNLLGAAGFGAVLLGVIIVVVTARAVPGSGAVSTHSGIHVCGQVIRAARLGHAGEAVTFTDPDTGASEDLVFPSAVSARVASGAAELISGDGAVIGREGDLLTLGGGPDGAAFAVCTVNGVYY